MMGARAARDEGVVPMGRQTQAATSRLPPPFQLQFAPSFPLARTSGQLELFRLQLLLPTAHPRRPLLDGVFRAIKRPQPAARAASQPTHERRRAVRDRVRLGELLNQRRQLPLLLELLEGREVAPHGLQSLLHALRRFPTEEPSPLREQLPIGFGDARAAGLFVPEHTPHEARQVRRCA